MYTIAVHWLVQISDVHLTLSENASETLCSSTTQSAPRYGSPDFESHSWNKSMHLFCCTCILGSVLGAKGRSQTKVPTHVGSISLRLLKICPYSPAWSIACNLIVWIAFVGFRLDHEGGELKFQSKAIYILDFRSLFHPCQPYQPKIQNSTLSLSNNTTFSTRPWTFNVTVWL